jgi:hypothetical protein
MAIDHIIPELDRKGLREFGLTFGAAIVIIFGLFLPWMFELDWPRWPWFVAAPVWALALIYPPWLRPVYRVWMRFGLLASRVMTPLVLGIVFFVMISPMALFRRLFGKDPLQRTLDPDQESYRVESTRSPKEKLERPF